MKLPSAHARPVIALRLILTLLVGIGIGVLFHYMLYRFSLPVQPFIYVAF